MKVMKDGHEPSLAREWERLRTLPKFSFFSQFHGTPTWGRRLMTRLTPIPRHLFRSEHLPKFYADISAALRVLHSNDIVHADIHLNNTMLRGFPPGFVLIDLASCTGNALFPLSLGYGVQGRGGAKYSPPHESLTPLMRSGWRLLPLRSDPHANNAGTLPEAKQLRKGAQAHASRGRKMAPGHPAPDAAETYLPNTRGILARLCY